LIIEGCVIGAGVGRAGHRASRRRGRLRIGPPHGLRAISRALASRSSAIGHLARA
jgi:hypothetical protein